MVHNKPEYQESLKLLTYSQLRRLEKMDLKKAREQKLLELARTGVEAGGRAAQGLFSNQIAGTAAFILTITALYPAWQPVVWGSLSVLAKDIGEAWRQSIIPTIDTSVGRDTANPTTTNPTPQQPDGTVLGWGIQVINANGAPVEPSHDRWYNNQGSRDAAFLLLQAPGIGIIYGDLWPNGEGTGYRKVKAVSQGGGVLTVPG